MRLWDDIRDHTMASMAPALIYEEASLIKRSIRDVYSRDVDEIIVDGEEGWKQAHDFMRMLMPSHAKKVQLWRPQGVAMPLFAKYQVDLQLDAMLAPTVQLKSGGYLVINQTEALVAVDVNSGRSTRERGIEETALKTNLEAADELGRQLRLRDLAGLIVIDFIDMEARRANAQVERRMKEALKNDRARIQLGAISHFGLMEMSRQRLRPSLAETSFVACPHCSGLGHVRSVESSAIHVLRSVEEEGSKLRAAAILVHACGPVVMYLLNNKRDRLSEIEARYAMRVSFATDDTLLAPAVRIDRLRAQVPEAERLLAGTPAALVAAPMADYDDEDEDDLVQDDAVEEAPIRARAPRVPAPPTSAAPAIATDAATAEEGERKRRRRRRRGGRRDGTAPIGSQTAAGEPGDSDGDREPGDSIDAGEDDDREETISAPPLTETETDAEDEVAVAGVPNEAGELDENGEPKARRRGRRGGRRRRRTEGGEGGDEPAAATAEPMTQASPAVSAPAIPAYTGPTPADPFNNTYDIFDMLEQAEQAAAQAPTQAPVVKQVPIAAHPPVETVPPELEKVHADLVEAEMKAQPSEDAVPDSPGMEVPAMEVPAAEIPAQDPQTETDPAVPAKRGWWRR
jgi:ribonuclease E